MSFIAPDRCPHCDQESELRPYGPNRSWICFPCAMATPETRAETDRNFVAMLDDFKKIAVIGLEGGPQELTPSLIRALTSKEDDRS